MGADDAQKWRDKFDDEHRLRKELEQEVGNLRKDCDDATLVRTDLGRRLETTVEEIEFLRRCHEEEIRELREQLAQSESKWTSGPTPKSNRQTNRPLETLLLFETLKTKSTSTERLSRLSKLKSRP